MTSIPERSFILRSAARTLHKWLALFVGLQVLLWMLGGVTFALLPFDAWVKSGDAVVKTIKPQPGSSTLPLEEIAVRHQPLQSLELIGQGRAPYYRATQADGRKFLIDPGTGVRIGPIDEARIRALAQDLYAGSSAVKEVLLIERIEKRWGLVDETHGRVPVWRVTYDDRFSTRLYFDPASGEFLRARNDTWVLYDFLWRLHIMDYGGGVDFNNAFLRILAPLALIFAASGAILLCFARFRRAAPARAR